MKLEKNKLYGMEGRIKRKENKKINTIEKINDPIY